MADAETPDSEPEQEHIYVRGEGGSIFKLDLPLQEAIEDRLQRGHITRVANADGDPYVDGGPFVGALPQYRPALTDSKPVWVGWAVANGANPDDAEALTKTDLIERYGVDTPPADPAVTDPAGEVTPDPATDQSDPAQAESGTDPNQPAGTE